MSGIGCPWRVFRRTTSGLSVKRPNDRRGFLSSAERSRERDGFALFEDCVHGLDDLELLGERLAVGPRLLETGFEPLEPGGDDAEIGEEHLVAERGELGGGVAAGEPVQDDQEGIAFADQGETLGVVGVGAGHQSGRIEKLDRSRRDFLGLVQRGQEIQPRVGEGGDSCLPGVDSDRDLGLFR